MEALVKSCNICWVWSGIAGMPSVLQNELQVSLRKVELFCLSDACSETSREATVLSFS